MMRKFLGEVFDGDRAAFVKSMASRGYPIGTVYGHWKLIDTYKPAPNEWGAVWQNIVTGEVRKNPHRGQSMSPISEAEWTQTRYDTRQTTVPTSARSGSVQSSASQPLYISAPARQPSPIIVNYPTAPPPAIINAGGTAPIVDQPVSLPGINPGSFIGKYWLPLLGVGGAVLLLSKKRR